MWRQFNQKKNWTQNEFLINVQLKQRIHNQWRFDWNMFYQVSGFKMRKKTTTTKSIFSISNEFFAFTFQFQTDQSGFKFTYLWFWFIEEKTLCLGGIKINSQIDAMVIFHLKWINLQCMHVLISQLIVLMKHSDLELAALDAIDSIIIACYSFALKFATKNSVFLFCKKNPSLT